MTLLRRDRYTVSDDPGHLDLGLIHRWLSDESYWAAGVPEAVMRRAVENSLNFGVYDGDPGQRQAAYARVVTDRATFGWLCDLFVLPDHRGKGLARLLMDSVMRHPELLGLRNFMLATRDAHGIYARSGFERIESSGRYMRIHRPYR
ncbi:GNAT family N-acetyltransferase [soil metagenome]